MALAQQIWERSREYIVFGALFLTALGIYVSKNSSVLRTARAISLALTAPVEGVYARANQFRRSLQENERLRAETVMLAAEVARLREARVENETLRTLLGFADSLDAPRIVARVVAKDMTRQANLMTLNVGSADSVEVGMPVINEQGIIGKVITVSQNYSVVMPHQNTRFAVPATVDELGRNGVVRWDGEQFDRLLMEYVVKTEPVTRGMLVRTSSFSGVFPPGIPIGRVDTAFAAQGRNDFIIHLTPSAPIGEVAYVYVLLARPDPEQALLEAAAQDTLGVGPLELEAE